MAYDESTAARLRDALAGIENLSERKMFGGLGFMINGNMALAAAGQGGVMMRIDPARAEELLADSRIKRMVMRGREMDGWLLLDEQAVAQDDEFETLIAPALEYAATLPPK